MKIKTVWVPRNYFSNSKVLETDVEVIPVEDFKKKLNSRLDTLREEAVKYKDCEFNAPQFRKGMIHQLEEILKDDG